MSRHDLVADCDRCAALCCVATSFEAGGDFAYDKPAGARCRHLSAAERCSIHAERAARGFSGCISYGCYGAGPRVTHAFAGVSERGEERDRAFLTLRVVYELLWLLNEASSLCPDSRPELAQQLADEIEALDAIARAPLARWRELDLTPRSEAAHAALRRLGEALGGRRALRVLGANSDGRPASRSDASGATLGRPERPPPATPPTSCRTHLRACARSVNEPGEQDPRSVGVQPIEERRLR